MRIFEVYVDPKNTPERLLIQANSPKGALIKLGGIIPNFIEHKTIIKEVMLDGYYQVHY